MTQVTHSYESVSPSKIGEQKAAKYLVPKIFLRCFYFYTKILWHCDPLNTASNRYYMKWTVCDLLWWVAKSRSRGFVLLSWTFSSKCPLLLAVSRETLQICLCLFRPVRRSSVVNVCQTSLIQTYTNIWHCLVCRPQSNQYDTLTEMRGKF